MSTDTIKARIYSIDFLRGVVMMIMLLDHTRDFVYHNGLTIDPTDMSTTTVPLFFSRWITHYCAPTFVFLSGVSIYLQKMNGKSNAHHARPSSGTQISCCFRKKRSSGMRRLNTSCRTGMSTQLW